MWDPVFQTLEIPETKLVYRPFTDEQKEELAGCRELTTYHPAQNFLRCSPVDGVKDGGYWLDHSLFWVGQKDPFQKGPCTISLKKIGTDTVIEKQAYCKLTHILDPIRWIKNRYTRSLDSKRTKALVRTQKRMKDPMNKAYVECLASYCLSRVRELDLSPHFPLFYGSFSGLVDTYEYDISDEYSTYRNSAWLWKGIRSNKCRLIVEPAEAEADFTECPSFINGDYKSATGSDTTLDTSDSEDELSDIDEQNDLETRSLRTADDLSFHSHASSDESTGSDESESDESEDPKLALEVTDFPVAIMYLEMSEGVIDSFLEDHSLIEAKPGTELWEAKWTAWIFQIIAGLCVAQATLSFTHNDLHTNNIVWSSTDKPFLYYSCRDGTIWKIPTYGKILRIIDFGRAIFRLKQQVIYSDDFMPGNDAATQYNFGPLQQLKPNNAPEVYPNASFDLSRLAVSLFEGLFPEQPAAKTGGALLSREPGLEIRETQSDLYNLLWSWMVTRSGENILINDEGDEKYPSFDLYTTIAAEIDSACPRDQVKKKIFKEFIMKKTKLPKDQKIYSLFF
jgi:hypothetical protein